MKEFLGKIIAAFDNHSKGFSARKLSAFAIICCVIVLHVKWFKSDRWEYLGEVLTLDFTFISVCLGMTTYENIKTKTPIKDEEIK